MRPPQKKAPESEQFTRFRELTGKLISVPKQEVDKQKEKHEKQKEKRPATK